MVHVDRGLLERAVANVVENAVKYSPSHEKVLVSASAIAERVEVRVVDRGPGVPDEDKDRILRAVPAVRRRAPRRRRRPRPGGRTCGFAEAMGATLSAEDPPGGGSRWCSACRRHRSVIRIRTCRPRPPPDG
ncbi:ATP-binding protein [Streptomyces sp. TLI_185]|uniref:sensor histidine kinase n=1 Tax=Streptomyces sp. TLI_185 TaxID=2485151 RepID=UPI0037D9DB97